MNKLITALLYVGILVLSGQSAAAHTLTTNEDEVGVLVYIQPNDVPVPGEDATLFFDITSDQKPTEASLLVTAPQSGQEQTVSAEINDGVISAKYVFATGGIYTLDLTAKLADGTTQKFTLSQKVVDSAEAVAPPLWAVLLGAASIVGLALLTTLSIIRWPSIKRALR